MKIESLALKKNTVQNKLLTGTLFLFMLYCFEAKCTSFILPEDLNKTTSVPMMRLQMIGLVNSLDETVVYYQSGATDDFDSNYDSYKLFGSNPAPHISQEYNSLLMAINGIEPVSQTFSINIRATTHVTGNFTITATDFADLPKGTCVYLNDLVTGTTVNILTTPYAFNLSNTTLTSRFVLSVTHYQLPIITTLTQPSCQLINGGKFKVTGTGNAPWNYVWKDSSGTTIKTSLNVSDSDSLEKLSNGIYNIEITLASNSCYYKDTTFSITQVILPNVSFISPDTLITSITQNYITLNQSANCQSYAWDFGDGIGNSSDFEPTYNYPIAGIYKTKLIGVSQTGCTDSTQKYINVISIATNAIVKSIQNMVLTNIGNNQFKIASYREGIDNLSFKLIDLKGDIISMQNFNLNANEELIVDLDTINSGIYVLSIFEKDRVLRNLKIYID